MGDLLELIFSNFLILAAVIGGIVSWFSGMTKEKETKQKREKNNAPSPSSYPSGPRSIEKPEEPRMKTGEERLNEYYEEKKKRMDELSGGAQEADPIQAYSYDKIDEAPQSHGNRNKKYAKDTPRQLSIDGPLIESAKKWDKKRLAEGILMREVLGPPRAHKPHSTHPRKR
ncbi:hypothetical protein [Halobacillus litoralis]|uniref:hypothetical protein n=1 Tax=Halobacillus litoralis TaxID=45668 RepID=UPI001CFE45FC|nr:hypothetical protein [Halobacillus litoralis]